VDEKTGRTLTAPLSKPRLDVNAVPCIFPDCPSYLSTCAGGTGAGPSREGPHQKKRRLEAAALEEAIQDSISTHMDYTRRMSVNNLQELKGKISLVSLPDSWHTIVKEDCIIFMFLLVAVQQHNVIYIVVDNNLKAEIYNKGVLLKVRLTSVNKESITNVNDLNSLVKQVDDFIKNSTDNKNSDKERNSVILGLIDQITEKDENGLIQFMKSQLCLSLQHKNKREYGTDFVIFCSLLLFISQHAYNFVRIQQSKYLS
jgi:uncharacterized protein (DUF1697 family)